MPFKSEKQRRYLWANEPEIAKKWSNYNQGGVAMSLTQAAEMLRNVAQTQGREAAMMMLNRHRGTLSPREYDAGMNIINMNTGGMIRMNMGGNVPRYNQGGGLLNHPYQREGEQFDTVPAMLTPGEFVVDADSAHKFGDELEQINNWEPNGEADESGEEYISEDEAVEIKRKFKDGTEIIVKSPEGSKTEVSGLLSSLTKAAKRKGYEPQKREQASMEGGILRANPGTLVPNAPQAPQPGGLLNPQQMQQAQAQQMAGLGFNLLGNSSAGNALSQMGRDALQGHQDYLSGQADAAQEATDDTSFGTPTWIDPVTGDKYVRRQQGGQLSFINVATGEVASQEVASRLNKAGTDGSGRAEEGTPPKGLRAMNDSVQMGRAISDAANAIRNGAGEVMHFLFKKSTTPIEIGKVVAAAKAAGGNEDVFTVLNALLGDAMVKAIGNVDQNLLDQYYNFLHNVSQFEVIASKTSGESRLTDEDAKRYLNAILNPNASVNSVLEQLGRAYFDNKYEEARAQAWSTYVNEQARADQRSEHFFNKNVWQAQSSALEGQRPEYIAEITQPPWTSSGILKNIIPKGDEDGAAYDSAYFHGLAYDVQLEGLSGTWQRSLPRRKSQMMSMTQAVITRTRCMALMTVNSRLYSMMRAITTRLDPNGMFVNREVLSNGY